MLRRAVELGVDHIDTAQYYGPDVANALIREALHPYADDLVLVSKVGAVRDDARAAGSRPSAPSSCAPASRTTSASLGVEQIGAVNLRRLPTTTCPRASQPVPFEDQLAEMVALRDEGKIAGIGVSTVTLARSSRPSSTAGIVCVQNAFSLVDRSDERGARPLCHEAGIAYVPYFPLGSAFPGMPKVTENDVVLEIAGRHRRHPGPGRARLAARAPRQRAAHPGHVERGAPRGEPAGRRDHPLRGRRRRPGQGQLTALSTAYAGLICSSMIASRSSNGRNADFIALIVNQRRSSIP